MKLKIFSILASLTISAMIVFFIVSFIYDRKNFPVLKIQRDIEQICVVLRKIDESCNIISTDSDVVNIDFLTVENFTGSEVGGLNLAYPEKWSGPYLSATPSVQGKPYILVKVGKDYFVMPGYGVKLPNGFTVGKDFDPVKTKNFPELLKKGAALNFDGAALAKKVDFKIGDWDPVFSLNLSRMKKLKRFVDEFNEALPFT
jgi:hypothetical protein